MSKSHEVAQEHQPVKLGSDRSFGLVFFVFFLVLGSYQWWKDREWWLWNLGLSTTFLLLALLAPKLLHPLNRLWFQFGMLLNRIVSPVVMGVLFFLFITPMSLVIRLLKHDLLRLKFAPQASTYWIERKERRIDPQRFKNQF